MTQKAVKEEIQHLRSVGYNITLDRDSVFIARTPKQRKPLELHQDGDYFCFGFSSDQHMASTVHRRDVLEDLYDKFAANGVKAVFNCGNWIDGFIPRINAHEVTATSLEGQTDILVRDYPQRDGLVTYSIWGDDHEGWYGKDAGIDVGFHAEAKMRQAGREDWVDLGFMDQNVLVKGGAKRPLNIKLLHAGGGSAYAESYQPQKIVESFSGGEKPHILLIGHYHKLSYNYIREVHTIQCGSTQGQTAFMRKKRIRSVLGGGIVWVKQNPNGIVSEMSQQFFTYY